MICSRCLVRRVARASRLCASIDVSTNRQFSVYPCRPTANGQRAIDTTSTASSDRKPPAATSTSAAQPFSTPATYGPGIEGTPTQPQKTNPARPKSSTVAGTPLRGLNYFKGKEDPVAMEDEEYPEWLWTLLDEKKSTGSATSSIPVDPRIYSKSENARRQANKRMRKARSNSAAAMEQKTPIFEQSIDLPNTPEESVHARHDLTQAMRDRRRKAIKEANFLKGMS